MMNTKEGSQRSRKVLAGELEDKRPGPQGVVWGGRGGHQADTKGQIA